MSWIFRVLEELGLAYTSRTTARGVRYAAFQLATQLPEGLSFSAISENGTFRLTAHDAVPPQLADEQLLVANHRLPLARAYRSPDDGSIEIALSFFIGPKELSSGQLGVLLGHLRESRAVVAGRSASAGGLPAITPAALELPTEEVALGNYHLSTAVDGAGWIRVRAGYLPAQVLPPTTEATLQRLQLWTVAGRFTVDPAGELGVEVATPLLGQPAGELIEWSTAQATLMLQVAARHLGLLHSG
jgi:hypothetical protein